MSGVNIRTANSRDVGALVHLLGQLFAIESDFDPNGERQERGLQRLLESDAIVLVAEVDHAVIGMVTAQFVISTAEGAMSAWLEDMVVDADWRGRGIGQQLLAAVCQAAVRRGCTRVQLVADRDNEAALEFYRHQGFSETRLHAWRRKLA